MSGWKGDKGTELNRPRTPSIAMSVSGPLHTAYSANLWRCSNMVCWDWLEAWKHTVSLDELWRCCVGSGRPDIGDFFVEEIVKSDSRYACVGGSPPCPSSLSMDCHIRLGVERCCVTSDFQNASLFWFTNFRYARTAAFHSAGVVVVRLAPTSDSAVRVTPWDDEWWRTWWCEAPSWLYLRDLL